MSRISSVMEAYLLVFRGSSAAVDNSRKAELMAKHSAISPVISMELSDTGSRNLLNPEATSCAVSAVAMRAMMASSY